MKMGIVVKVEKNKCLLLSDGQYFSTKANGNQSVGDVIPVRERKRTGIFAEKCIEFFKVGKFSKVIVATCLVCTLGLATYAQNVPNTAFAYMTIDINPSFELTIDENMNVIHVFPLNKEAMELSRHTEQWIGKKMEDVTYRIIELCEDKGYLKENGRVLVSTTVDKDVKKEAVKKTKEKLKKFASKLEKEEFTLISVEATPLLREKANREGLSTGEYVLKAYSKELEKAKSNEHYSSKAKIEDKGTAFEVMPINENKVLIRFEKESVKKEKEEVKREPEKNTSSSNVPSTKEPVSAPAPYTTIEEPVKESVVTIQKVEVKIEKASDKTVKQQEAKQVKTDEKKQEKKQEKKEEKKEEKKQEKQEEKAAKQETKPVKNEEPQNQNTESKTEISVDLTSVAEENVTVVVKTLEETTISVLDQVLGE